MKNLMIFPILLMFLFVTFTGNAQAQATGGSLSGTLLTASGDPIPNARIELENVATGHRISATTNSSGRFRLQDVPVGRYRLHTTTTGAASPAGTQELEIELGRTASVTLRLPSAGPATDVFATADVVPVDPKPASVNNTFNDRYVHYLPKPNFVTPNEQPFGAYNLTLLNEAIVMGPSFGVTGPAIAGNRPITNNFHIEGIDNNNRVNPGPLVYVSNEATTNFSLFQNQPTPLFGHSSGGQLNSVVRTGANRVHGSLYNYLQNRQLNAMDARMRNFGINERPRHDQNRMGASFGTPIVPNNLFFYGNFEYLTQGFSGPMGQPAFAPTAAGLATLRGLPGVSQANINALQSFAGDVGTATRTATVGGASIPLGLVNTNTRSWRNSYFGTGALDWNLAQAHQIRTRYIHNEMEANNLGFGLPAFQTPQNSRALMASGSWTALLHPTIDNELRLGYQRFRNVWDPANVNFMPGMTGSPNLQIGGVNNLAFGMPFFQNQTSGMNTYHLANTLGIRGSGHQLRLGFDGRRTIGSLTNFSGAAGNYAYSSLQRFVLDLPPDIMAQRNFGHNSFDMGQTQYFGFVQDTYSWRSNFHLDFGARYSYSTIPTGLRWQELQGANVGVPGLIEFNRPTISRNNFAPFLGMAWSPDLFQGFATVIRAGFGMHYDQLYPVQMNLMGGFAPALTQSVMGNLQGQTPGFLAGGGLQAPFTGAGGQLTTAQARALTTAYIQDQRLPYTMQWNLAIQQGLWRNATLEVKYLGNRGIRQPVYGFMGDARVTATNNLPLFYQQPTQAQLNALTTNLNQLQNPVGNPFFQAGFTNPIHTIRNEGNSWYNAAVFQLNHRLTGGAQLFGQYTWSRFEDDASGTPMDLGMAPRQRGWSMFDRRHRVNATALFDLGSVLGFAPTLVRNLLDFSISGTYNFQSPARLPILGGADAGLAGTGWSNAIMNPSGTAGVGSGVTPLTNNLGQTVAYRVNNPNAQWIAGAPGVFTGGDRGNVMRLNRINNFDVAAVKRFGFGERAAIELRGEAYNLLNRSQFVGGGVHSIGGMNFLNMMQGFQTPGNPEFMQFQNVLSSNPRTLQLALRFTF